MELYRPRKLKAGQTLNESDEKWDKEYKLLGHRINYIEKVVKTGKDFPDPEVNNRDPPATDPTFKMIRVHQENSPNVLTEGHFTTLRTQIYKITENSNLSFGDLVEATNNDPVLAKTRQMLIDGKPESEVPLPYRTIYHQLTTNLGVVAKDDKIVLPTDLRGMFLQTVHGNHEGVAKMLESAKLCWWPGMDQDIRDKARNCVRCIQNGKNLKTKLTSKDLGKLRTLTGPNQEVQIDFYGPFKFQNKKKF